jgi:hypothetical protein
VLAKEYMMCFATILQYPVFDDSYKKKTAKDQTSKLNKQYPPLLDKVKGINLIVSESLLHT